MARCETCSDPEGRAELAPSAVQIMVLSYCADYGIELLTGKKLSLVSLWRSFVVLTSEWVCNQIPT
jgi:hypothetical protein